MKKVVITLEPKERLEKLIQYYEDDKLVGFEVKDGWMRETEAAITNFFYPD